MLSSTPSLQPQLLPPLDLPRISTSSWAGISKKPRLDARAAFVSSADIAGLRGLPCGIADRARAADFACGRAVGPGEATLRRGARGGPEGCRSNQQRQKRGVAGVVSGPIPVKRAAMATTALTERRRPQDAAPGPWKAGPRDWDLQLADAWKWEQTGDAVGAYGALALTLALGESGWLSRLGPAGDLPYFMALAACTIYIGAHRGLTSKTRQTLSLGQGAAAPLLASGEQWQSTGLYHAMLSLMCDDAIIREAQHCPHLSPSPSPPPPPHLSPQHPTTQPHSHPRPSPHPHPTVSLFGAYLLIKYLPNFDLQTILNAYFWLLGSVSVAGALPGPLGVLGGALGQKSIDVKVPEGLLLDEEGEVVTEGKVAPTDILAVVIG